MTVSIFFSSKPKKAWVVHTQSGVSAPRVWSAKLQCGRARGGS